MSEEWTQARLQAYIDDGTEESLTLDYKRAASLGKNNDKRTEITKDVSAMVNSDGGLIIYGIAEYDDEPRKHLPEKLDPIDRTRFSREWLQQVINNIRPRIDGLIIYPVKLDTGPNDVAYVVDIPKGITAHQALDKKYYQRFNFQAEPMYDHEIRDVMARAQHPKIELEFSIEIKRNRMFKSLSVPSTLSPFGHPRSEEYEISRELVIRATNIGSVYAQYVNAFFEVPVEILPPSFGTLPKSEIVEEDGQKYYEFYEDNTVRDTGGGLGRITSLAARYDPILPGLSRFWRIELGEMVDGLRRKIHASRFSVKYSVCADNAPRLEGSIAVSEIPIVDLRSQD